jgi:hypothetical protein
MPNMICDRKTALILLILTSLKSFLPVFKSVGVSEAYNLSLFLDCGAEIFPGGWSWAIGDVR